MIKKLILLTFTLISSISYSYITDDITDKKIRAECRDGKFSTSIGSGACSHHGGIKRIIRY